MYIVDLAKSKSKLKLYMAHLNGTMAEQTKEDKDKIFSKDDVAAHNKDGDLWIIVEDKVYDMSSFQKLHPGGEKGS